MKLEVLISCMYQEDMRLAAQTGITTDALIINQCPERREEDVMSEQSIALQQHYIEENAAAPQSCTGEVQNVAAPQSCTDELQPAAGHVRMLTTASRGLSKSRNLAIAHARGDVCLLCDDDEALASDYEEMIQKAYAQLPEADILCFRIANQPSRLRQETQQLNKWTALRIASWQISFRREAIEKSGIRFDEDMGAGTGHGGGEEVKFLRDCISAGLKAYYVPESIGTVAQQDSTWFQGYDRDFFYKRGITNRYMLGLPVAVAYALYYTLTKRALYRGTVTVFQSFWYTLEGILGNDIAQAKKR